MKVEIISTQNVKPSSPTPLHLRNLTLSFLDQKCAPLLIPTLLFYTAPERAAPLDITRLKSCLSQTLTTFYPLAGRYQTWGTVLCNDEGIPFVEAEVSYPLSSVVGLISSSSSFDLLPFYPPKENLISSGIHLAIQVSKFSCGGFSIGWYHTHKVTDGTSAATFLRHWSALVTKRYEDAAEALPDFNAPVIAFPPVPEEDKTLTPELNHKEKQEGEERELNHKEKDEEQKIAEKAEVEIPKLKHKEKHEEKNIAFPLTSEKDEVVIPELVHKEKQEGEEIDVHPVPEEVKALTHELNHKENKGEKIALPPEPEKVADMTPELNHKETREGEKKENVGKGDFMFKKRIVVRSFVLNNKAVTELKAKSVSKHVPNPSRFVSVASFLWKHIALATSKEGRTMLSILVDLRSRSNPPLAKGAMGNIFEMALAQAEKQAQLPELVAAIHGSISKMKDLVPEYQGENRIVAKEKYGRNIINSVMENKGKDVYLVSPWCKSSGFKDIDFGFGKPKWISG